MEDDEYARKLFAILTNTHPTGIDPSDPYGQADDGIDRYTGFGRDVWVTSVEVVDDEHGAELLVEFKLAVPSDPRWRSLPRRGTVRLPCDAEWRELSGYDDPAAYAPAVASAIERAALGHVQRHLKPPGQSPPLPSREQQWQILLAALGSHREVREVAPDRIELREPEGDAVTVVVSPDQWERVLLDHAWTDVEMYLDELIEPREEDETFVVFYKGDLARSTREELPPVRSRAKRPRT